MLLYNSSILSSVCIRTGEEARNPAICLTVQGLRGWERTNAARRIISDGELDVSSISSCSSVAQRDVFAALLPQRLLHHLGES